MKKLAIIHYMPLEYYPPVMNMLEVLTPDGGFETKVWTTKNTKGREVYKNSQLKHISRTVFPKPEHFKMLRLMMYLWFNVKVFLGLIVYNPKLVFYYESYSAGPVYWYIKIFGKGKKLFIHHHEYFNQAWYDTGMAVVKLYHEYEKNYLFKKAIWISQTNQFRVDLFLEDHKDLSPSKLHVMPNYPPDSWHSAQKKTKVNTIENNVLNVIYVGSLSLEHTFIAEFCSWVLSQKGKVNFDIYAFNCNISTTSYLNGLNSEFIKFHDSGIAYNDIPKVLVNYDIGVILYKARTLNAEYCASNKLFEYLVCGLEVWVSKEQKGTIPYLNKTTRPRVKALNFLKLDEDLIRDYYKSLQLPSSNQDFRFKFVSRKIISAFKDS